MRVLARRLLAMLLAALMAAALLAPGALAADWRDLLRDAFGLTDGGGDLPDPGGTEAPPGEDRWALPITEPQRIVDYLAAFGELPENFVTKAEARALGWDSRINYVGDVAPGKSIGGDRFGNYEGLLPDRKGRKWYECDANYGGGRRGAERVVYSSDGLYYYTDDHYQTFTEMFPEDGLT